ncbi:hypothetical protein JCM5350_004077 [Sporobolomyces pararoseus]
MRKLLPGRQEESGKEKKELKLSLRSFAKKHLNFYRIHFLCFSVIPIVAAGIVYASNGPSPEQQIPFIDCLFMSFSAMTACGLTTVMFANITVWQQVILFLLTLFGSLSSVSIMVILVRRHYFRKRFQHLLVHSPEVRERVRALSRQPSADSAQLENEGTQKSTIKRKVRFPGTSPSQLQQEQIDSRAPQVIATDSRGFPNPIESIFKFFASRIDSFLRQRQDNYPRTSTLVSVRSTNFGGEGAHNVERVVSHIAVGRNSRFLNLTTEQAEELGGVEYRALSLLLKIVIGYWLLLQLIGVTTIAPYMTYSKTYRPVFEPAESRPINPTWFSFFLCISAFGNNGMSIVDNSMVDFQQAYWLLIMTGILVLAGNTALPVFLRLTIWTGSQLVPRESRTKETMQYLLDHPRRTYIYLFPARQTWLLVFLLFLFNGVDWLFFWLLDIGNATVEALSPAAALATRTAGFQVVNLAEVAPALQFTLAVVMYISAYPLAISVRSTNAYEDQSVGIHETEEYEETSEEQNQPSSSFLLSHVRRQLSFDIGFLAFAIFLLEVTIFSLIFEIISAYACVGLSLGTSRNSASLAGVLRTLSKLVLIATMVRGRHRGLPVAIDRSILLPSELEEAQESESERE